MATLSAPLFSRDTLPGFDDDNMEISSDAGRPAGHDDDIDIDIDIATPQPPPYNDESMIDEDADFTTHVTYKNFDVIQDDDMLDDGEDEDGMMQDEPEHPFELHVYDEELKDATLVDEVEVDAEGDTEIYDDHGGNHVDPPLESGQIFPSQDSVTVPPPEQSEAIIVNYPPDVHHEAQEFEHNHNRLDELGDDTAINPTLVPAEDDALANDVVQAAVDNAIDDPAGLQIDQSTYRSPTDEMPPPTGDLSATVGSGQSQLSELDTGFNAAKVAVSIDDEHPVANAELARTASHEVSSAIAARVHPIVVLFSDQEIDLFRSDRESESATSFLLEDKSIINSNLQDFFSSCRLALGQSISDNEELELGVVELELSLSEDSNQASLFSLSDVLDVYMQLYQNDGVDNIDPLYLTLTMKHRFATRMTELSSAVRDGLGWSAVSHAENDTEPEYAEHNDAFVESGGEHHHAEATLPVDQAAIDATQHVAASTDAPYGIVEATLADGTDQARNVGIDVNANQAEESTEANDQQDADDVAEEIGSVETLEELHNYVQEHEEDVINGNEMQALGADGDVRATAEEAGNEELFDYSGEDDEAEAEVADHAEGDVSSDVPTLQGDHNSGTQEDAAIAVHDERTEEINQENEEWADDGDEIDYPADDLDELETISTHAHLTELAEGDLEQHAEVEITGESAVNSVTDPTASSNSLHSITVLKNASESSPLKRSRGEDDDGEDLDGSNSAKKARST